MQRSVFKVISEQKFEFEAIFPVFHSQSLATSGLYRVLMIAIEEELSVKLFLSPIFQKANMRGNMLGLQLRGWHNIAPRNNTSCIGSAVNRPIGKQKVRGWNTSNCRRSQNYRFV